MSVLKVAIVVPDDRDERGQHEMPRPYFGTAVTALLEGFAVTSEVEIHIVSCTHKAMAAPIQIERNIYYHSVLVPGWGWMRGGYVECIRRVKKLLKRIHPQIVHGQGTERYAGLSAAFSGFPNVITIHGNMQMIADLLKPKLFSYLWVTARYEPIALGRTAGVFCNSAYTRQHVDQFARKTWLAPNALRMRFFSPPKIVPTHAPVLLNIGVISRRKAQCSVLDLGQRLHERGHGFQIQFVGRMDSRDPYCAAFQEQMRVAEGKGYARYLGEKSEQEVIDLMDSASALVHIPTEESFGLVAIEALARNLRVFASRVGGLVDIAEGIPDAKLFNLEDRAGLEGAIAEWLAKGTPRSNDSVEQMRKRYHPAVIANRHIEIYREVLGSSRLR